MMKRIRRFLACRRNGGFTLAEMIISCALLGILILGIVMFISPILETVSTTNASTRASNAAESIEYYISRSIRNAAYIAVFTDTGFSDVQSPASDTIAELKAKTDSNYSLKCISVRYAMDDKSQTYKYFICNETVETSGALKSNPSDNLDPKTLVFDPCYFDGIYPKVVLIQVQQEQDDGSNKAMPAVKIDVEVYDDPQMRKSTPPANDLIFTGTGYTILRNIELSQQDKSLKQPFNILPATGGSLGTLPVPLHSDDDTMKETYIYYVERTLATVTSP